MKLDSSFIIGIAFATPFFVDYIGWRYGIIFVMPLIILIIRRELEFLNLKDIPVFVWVCIVIYISEILSLVLTETLFLKDKIRGLAVFVVLLFSFLLSSKANSEDIIKHTFKLLIALNLILAIIGLLKFAFQQNGYLFDIFMFLHDNSKTYPQGTNLTSDYNITSIIYLTSLIGIISLLPKKAIFSRYHIVLIILLSAGIMIGSRRFIILSPILIIFWMTTVFHENDIRTIFTKSIPSILLIVACSILIIFALKNPDAPTKLNPTALKIISFKSIANFSLNVIEGKTVEAPNRSDPMLILNTMKEVPYYGMSARFDKWEYALELIQKQNWIKPMWFTYHEKFSCKFVNCEYIDYPHMPILSATLMGGLPLGILAVFFYILLFYGIFRVGKDGWYSGISPAILAIMPFSLISGDTIFSLSHIVALGLLIYTFTRLRTH